MAKKRVVGVLALQGDFEAHRKALEHAGAEAVEVRTKAELDSVDGLVIPGGESTTMLKLLRLENLFDDIREFGQTKPIFGTCAGAILLARHVTNPEQESFGLMDIEVERNAYGRQLDSRVVKLDGDVEAVFIRAPIIRGTGPGVKVLKSYGGTPVLAEQGLHMVATFHPELSSNSSIHGLFLDKIPVE
jgi:pyridoxal 5'-phosphate synthase pdxT subunit